MLASLGRLRGLLIPRLLAVLRLAAELILVAALLGRSAPEPVIEPAPRQPAHERYSSVDGEYVGDFPGHPAVLLDTETGALAPYPVAGMGYVGRLGCSPWRDAAGRYHFVGVRRESAGGGHVLARFTFPAGRVLDQVKIEVLPSRRPCWFPDRSDRILFAGTDRRLYLLHFPEVRGSRSSAPAAPRAVRWQIEPPGAGAVWLRDPCWPSAPALGGRLIVSLSYIEDAPRREWKSHLWWLQLSPDGDAIVGAERAIGPDALGSSQASIQEFGPNVGMTSDGMPLEVIRGQEPIEK